MGYWGVVLAGDGSPPRPPEPEPAGLLPEVDEALPQEEIAGEVP